MTLEPVAAGYRAFNGYIFSEAQARAYNAAVARAKANPSEANLNGAHSLFSSIIATPANNRAAGIERSLFWQRHVLANAKNPEQEARARAAIARLEAEQAKEG